MADIVRNIGLSLGADLCWPACYEHIMRRLDLRIPHGGDTLRFEVERARGFFDRGSALLPLLPRIARVDVNLFIAGGRAILDAVEKQEFNVWKCRPEVGTREKLKLLLGSLWTELIQ